MGIKSTANLMLQVSVVLVSFLLRFSAPGLLLLLGFLFIPIPAAVQIVPAVRALSRRRLSVSATIWSLATAGCCLGAGLFLPDGGDAPNSVQRPADVLLGVHLSGWASVVGVVCLLGWIVAAVVTFVVVFVAGSAPPVAPGAYSEVRATGPSGGLRWPRAWNVPLGDGWPAALSLLACGVLMTVMFGLAATSMFGHSSVSVYVLLIALLWCPALALVFCGCAVQVWPATPRTRPRLGTVDGEPAFVLGYSSGRRNARSIARYAALSMLPSGVLTIALAVGVFSPAGASVGLLLALGAVGGLGWWRAGGGPRAVLLTPTRLIVWHRASALALPWAHVAAVTARSSARVNGLTSAGNSFVQITLGRTDAVLHEGPPGPPVLSFSEFGEPVVRLPIAHLEMPAPYLLTAIERFHREPFARVGLFQQTR